MRLTSNRNFWGLSAYDHQGSTVDWGHSWLAKRFLTNTYTVSFSPGVINPAAVSATARQPQRRLHRTGRGRRLHDPANRDHDV